MFQRYFLPSGCPSKIFALYPFFCDAHHAGIGTFSALLKCGECGWSLSAANTKNQSRYYRCTQYSAHGKEACSLHFITYNLLYAFVLGRLQYWLMAVKKNEDAILERLLQSSEKQRRSENARDEKELKKAQKILSYRSRLSSTDGLRFSQSVHSKAGR